MSDSRVMGGTDRLPWLSDEPARKAVQAKRGAWDWTGWAICAVLILAGFSFWLGGRSVVREVPQKSTSQPAPVATMPQQPVAQSPEVRVAPQPQVARAVEPQVRIVRVPEVRIVQQVVKAAPSSEKQAAPEEVAAAAPPPNTAALPAAPKASAPVTLRPWPPRVVAGASGRLVQIGAYGSGLQAKQGWVAMVRAYPALQKLPAVVVITRNSKRRLFYRFQIGTTSQAHSEVLCQRMEKISLSCAVVGLPWKAKVER